MDRQLCFKAEAWEDYLYWQAQDKKRVKRINALIKDTLRAPFDGLGKPEPLKNNLSGLWSRHIDGEHRLVYRVTDETLEVIQCRTHYE